MPEVEGIWIIEEATGNVIFSDECFIQGSEAFNSALFTGFISAIENFIQEIGEKKAETIELGNSKIFLAKEEPSKLIFVLRASLSAKEKKMKKNLEKIVLNFHENYAKFLSTPENLREHIFHGLHKDIHKITGENMEKKIQEFFISL
ncbi:MAG: hypothetical protein EAX96_16295 [Candidatus Lokiarchaeota archaeon]|nr:hypothetical protein [Candidatus Lokiarchaeota archaeon]